MRQSGYTLIELMCWCALSVILFGAMIGISNQLRRSERVAADYVQDLTGCRRALRTLEWDVRSATRVETIDTRVRVHHGPTAVDYTLADGVLTRAAGGATRVLARRIRAVTARQDGRTVTLRLALLARRRNAPEAAIRSTVHLRHGGRP